MYQAFRIKRLLIFLMIFHLFPLNAFSQELQLIENSEVRILFELPLSAAAQETVAIYPETRSSLEKRLGWRLVARPTVILVNDSRSFERMAPHSLAVAFAEPRRHLIVIDYTKISRRPFTLQSILKHELCHLLLHHHIPEDLLPKWLDEGVCQWSSDWVMDIIVDHKQSVLNQVALQGRFIPMEELNSAFPYNKDGLTLAYEQSKSFVAFIDNHYGADGLLEVLGYLKNGKSIDTAFQYALRSSFNDLERAWHDSLSNKTAWFMHLSYYLYEILFGLMALLSIVAFIRIVLKKRAYFSGDPEDGLPP